MTFRKALISSAMVFFSCVIMFGSTQKPTSSPAKFNGYITDTWCGVNRSKKPPTAVCTRACVHSQGAKYAFFNTADHKLYVVDQQSEVAPFAGEAVNVQGTVQHAVQHIDTMLGDRTVDTMSVESIQRAK